MNPVIGTAGWSIAARDAAAFAPEGSALERYSRRFGGVEINSSFHRPHRTSTWAKWGESVPEGFRFAVKIPKTVTHHAKLVDCAALISRFAEEVRPLAEKLAVLLVQLPPKQGFNPQVAEPFFAHLRQTIDAEIACEPRNADWFEPAADVLLEQWRIARVAADPARWPAAARPGGWRDLAYWRLHGSPVMYRSAYSETALDHHARQIEAAMAKGSQTWCIFDNTAGSEATANALSLMVRSGSQRVGARVRNIAAAVQAA